MIKRKKYEYIKKSLDSYTIPIIIGHRRVGKTTILQQLKEEYTDVYFLDFDDPDYRIMESNLIFHLLVEQIDKGAKVLLLDEIQEIKDWDNIIKKLYDYYVSKKIVKIAVTGSSTLSLKNKDTGVDRTEIIYLGTLTFTEYCQLTNKEKTFEHFENFLLNGGFPKYSIENIDWSIQHKKILSPILSSDIPKEYGIRTNNVEKLLVALSKNTNGEFNRAQYSQRTSITGVLIDEYMDILEQCMLIKRVYKVDENGDEPKYSRFKVYINPHFHLWLLKKSWDTIENIYKGQIIESYWLFSSIQEYGHYERFNYLKDHENKEIDFVFPEAANPKYKFERIIEFKYIENQINQYFPMLNKTMSKEKIVICKEDGKNKEGIIFKNILNEF